MTQTQEPEHPILDKPFTWAITELHWRASGVAEPSSFLDVTFARDGQLRRLRFADPQQVVLELSAPSSVDCGDMVIRDISDRQLDGLSVQVTDNGADGTPLSFYAKGVIEVPCN